MASSERPARKLKRALRRGAFRTADLFAGCGGLSLGFHRAGFRSVLAVEANEDALDSHVLNFSGLASPDRYAAFLDARKVSPREAVRHLVSPQMRTEDAVDVVIGGPPCQAFSLLGRAALWDIAKRKHAHADDPRATLYEHFLTYVEHLQPIAFVMENVPEIGKFAGGNLAEDIAKAATALGYVTRYALLNAAWYGVPQYRERMFILGIRKELGMTPGFPQATHWCDLPRGYATSRAGSDEHFPVFEPLTNFVDFSPIHNGDGNRLPRTPTAGEALCDLPRLKHHLNGADRNYYRQVDEFIAYGRRTSEFADEMRSWPDFEAGDRSDCHAIRLTPRDYRLFRKMKPGDMYPQAAAIAQRVFRQRLSDVQRRLGTKLDARFAAWRELKARIVPPYEVSRYPNKYRKMSPNEPAHTVPAHLGKDCYSHIHFDSKQARSISVREAARLQSFPDGFAVCGSMNSRFTQIGNAVPPLLAFALATRLKDQLKSALRTQRTERSR